MHDGTLILSLLGAVHFYSGELDRAIADLSEAKEIMPHNYRPRSISELPHLFLFWAQRTEGKLRDPNAQKNEATTAPNQAGGRAKRK